MSGRRGRIKVLESGTVPGAHMFWGWLYPCLILCWDFFFVVWDMSITAALADRLASTNTAKKQAVHHLTLNKETNINLLLRL